MQLNEPFPLESFPPRVRNAIVDEFQGRQPCILEVASISDKRWLATPAIGPVVLRKIRSLTEDQAQQAETPSEPRLPDAELLERLVFLEEELHCIRDGLEAMLAKALRNRDRSR